MKKDPTDVFTNLIDQMYKHFLLEVLNCHCSKASSIIADVLLVLSASADIGADVDFSDVYSMFNENYSYKLLFNLDSRFEPALKKFLPMEVKASSYSEFCEKFFEFVDRDPEGFVYIKNCFDLDCLSSERARLCS